MTAPQDPFDPALDAVVFGDAQLPIGVLPFEAGFAWWRDAFALIRRDALRWIASMVLFLLIGAALALLPYVGGLLSYLAETLMIGGVCLGCQAVDAGGRFQVAALFLGFQRPHRGRLIALVLLLGAGFFLFFLVLGIAFGMFNWSYTLGHLHGLPDMHSLALLLPSLLLAILALSLVAMLYGFAPGLIVLHGLGPVDAMRLSFVASCKNVGPMLAFAIVGLLGMLALGILGPMLALAIVKLLGMLGFAEALGTVDLLALLVGIVIGGLAFVIIAPMAMVTLYTSTRAVFGAGRPLPVSVAPGPSAAR